MIFIFNLGFKVDKDLNGQAGQRELSVHGSLAPEVNAFHGDKSQPKDRAPSKLEKHSSDPQIMDHCLGSEWQILRDAPQSHLPLNRLFCHSTASLLFGAPYVPDTWVTSWNPHNYL